MKISYSSVVSNTLLYNYYNCSSLQLFILWNSCLLSTDILFFTYPSSVLAIIIYSTFVIFLILLNTLIK